MEKFNDYDAVDFLHTGLYSTRAYHLLNAITSTMYETTASGRYAVDHGLSGRMLIGNYTDVRSRFGHILIEPYKIITKTDDPMHIAQSSYFFRNDDGEIISLSCIVNKPFISDLEMWLEREFSDPDKAHHSTERVTLYYYTYVGTRLKRHKITAQLCEVFFLMDCVQAECPGLDKFYAKSVQLDIGHFKKTHPELAAALIGKPRDPVMAELAKNYGKARYAAFEKFDQDIHGCELDGSIDAALTYTHSEMYILANEMLEELRAVKAKFERKAKRRYLSILKNYLLEVANYVMPDEQNDE